MSADRILGAATDDRRTHLACNTVDFCPRSGDAFRLGRNRPGDKAAGIWIDKKDFQRLWAFVRFL